MVQGGVRWVFKGVAAVALLILVVGALLAARLSQGPLPLDLLNPYILDIVNDSDADVRFSLGGTELHWGGVQELFDLRVRDVRAFDRDGVLIAAVPDASVSIDAGPLIREGRLVLDAFTLHGGIVNLRREEDGTLVFAMASTPESETRLERRVDTPAEALNDIMDILGLTDAVEPGAEPPPVEVAGIELPDMVRISDAHVVIDDRVSGVTWRMPHVNAEVRRRVERVEAEASVSLALPDGRETLADVVASLDRAGVIDARFDVQ